MTNEVIFTAIESFYKAENDSRSENKRMDHRQRALDGSPKPYNRKCYGYVHNQQGS